MAKPKVLAVMDEVAEMPRAGTGVSSTAASASAKTVTISGFQADYIKKGTIVSILFSNGNTATNLTLNINGYGAQPIDVANGLPISELIGSTQPAVFQYDGAKWWLLNPRDDYLPLKGGAMAGTITLSGDPSQALHAATKQYIDNKISALTDVSSAISVHNSASDAHPTLFDSKTDKVSGATAGNLAALDNNGNLTDSGKKTSDFASASHTHDYVPTTRKVNNKALSGDITLSASDVGADTSGTASGAVSTHNSDSGAHSTLLSGKLDKSGGTMTGALTASNPAVTTSAVRNIYAGTTDMTAGTTALETGVIYFVYE